MGLWVELCMQGTGQEAQDTRQLWRWHVPAIVVSEDGEKNGRWEI